MHVPGISIYPWRFDLYIVEGKIYEFKHLIPFICI